MDVGYESNYVKEWTVDGDDDRTVASERWKELRTRFDLYCHLLLDWGELRVCSFLNGLLDWIIVLARSGGPLFATPSGDIATWSVTALHNRVSSLEQQLQAGKQRLKDRESEHLGQLLVADERSQTASTFAKASLKRQSILKHPVASLRGQQSAIVPTAPVDAQSEVASVREDLKAANAVIGKLRTEEQTGPDQV